MVHVLCCPAQVLTRKQPYAGLNFMSVSLDVLEGRRPKAPTDCPSGTWTGAAAAAGGHSKPIWHTQLTSILHTDYKQLMKKCWHAVPDKRPSMQTIISFFESHQGSGEAGTDRV